MAGAPPVDSSVTVDTLEDDPYPTYARLRAEAPVCRVEALDAVLVTRWADVTEIGTHPEVFTAPTRSPLRDTLGENVLTISSGPAHRRLRLAMERKLKRRTVEAYAPALVTRIAEPYLADIAARGSAELMADFLEPVAVLSLADVLGLADVDAPTLRRWFAALAAGGSNYEGDPEKAARGLAAGAEIDEFAGPLVDRLRREPADSLLSDLVAAGLSRAEVLANLKLILLGGMQEPGHAAGNTVWALLTHPDQAAAVRADPELVDAAVEEGLRWLSPVGTATRSVAAPVELGGVRLPAGTRIAAVLSSANRDEAHVDDGELFDVRRARVRQCAFGIGGHFCAGHWLAREQMRVMVGTLFERFPRLRLDPDRRAVLRGWEFRGAVSLPVLV